MSIITDYEQRTSWKYNPIRGIFPSHKDLPQKVKPDGSYASFPGSTVVFRPDKHCRDVIALMQRIFHEKLKNTEMLAVRLPQEFIHMTLHDMISPETCAADYVDELKSRITESAVKATEITEEIRREYAGIKIRMTADRIVNMLSKSLVLLLRPETERDYELLMELHHRYDVITELPYPFTPHITLAYFKAGMIDGDTLGEAVYADYLHPIDNYYDQKLCGRRKHGRRWNYFIFYGSINCGGFRYIKNLCEIEENFAEVLYGTAKCKKCG